MYVDPGRPLVALLEDLALDGWSPVLAAAPCHAAKDPGAAIRAVLERDGERIVLKERATYLGVEEFRFQVAAHRRLADAGAPVPAVPAGLADRVAACAPAGRDFHVYAWVDGRTLRADAPADVACLAASLARFHAHSTSLVDEAGGLRHREPRDRFGKTRFYRPLLDRGLGSLARDRADRLYRALDDAEAALTHRSRLCVLHGDVDVDNAVASGEECVLIDLDDLHVGPPLSDLAWLMTLTAGMAKSPGPPAYRFREAWNTELLQAIADGYAAGATLHADDRADLPSWLVASIACATVDAFYHDGWLIDARAVATEVDLALSLIDAVDDVHR